MLKMHLIYFNTEKYKTDLPFPCYIHSCILYHVYVREVVMCLIHYSS